MERELLSIVETLKELRNILLGQKIEVYTDQKNLICLSFIIVRVMRWQLILEEFSPKLIYITIYIKGSKNFVADPLSCIYKRGVFNYNNNNKVEPTLKNFRKKLHLKSYGYSSPH